jgi:acyl-CoA thioesterase-1
MRVKGRKLMNTKKQKTKIISIIYISFIFTLFLQVFSCSQKENEMKPLEPSPKTTTPQKKKILFFGDSLTEGLGLSFREESYPYQIQSKLKNDGLDCEIINAGVSGDTTSGGLSRLDWVISTDFDLFVLELGANDMMRGVKPSLVEENLKKIISRVKQKNPKTKILLIPMKPFPNLGIVYGKKFEKIYKNVSESEKVPLSNFLLEKVAGIKSLNQKDGIHPTKEGHMIMADTIYEDVKKLLLAK